MPVLKQNEVFAGRYLLIQLLGEGGFSEVWKAKDQMADDAVVAIKIYAPEKGLDDHGLRQFRNEFSITYNLSHPHLLKVYHYDIVDGSPYLIMPYCPFGSLTNMLREEGVFSERQVALVMCQIGSALEEVHRQDQAIVHQDIKPDNILLLHPECFMLADFGISSRIRNTVRKATTDFQTLTVAYAPPERFDRHPTSDPSSDIFSLGVTLYEMCTNKVPWDGAGGQCLLKGAAIPALPGSYAPELNEILEACMSVDGSKRPTAAEIHERGRHFLETGAWKAPKKRKEGRQKSNRAVVSFLVAAAIALVAIAGFWMYQNLNPNSIGNSRAINTASVLEEDKGANQLEDKLKSMEAELVKANQRLSRQDSINNFLVQGQLVPALKNGNEAAKQAEAADSQNNEKQQAETAGNQQTETAGNQQTETAVKQQTEAAAAKARAVAMSRELQKYLNQISDPNNSRAARSGWKQETLSRFADGSVRVLDESDGTLTEYRAGIFLTLLLTSPHQVVVREVKTDSNNKITELRLTKQPIRSDM